MPNRAAEKSALTTVPDPLAEDHHRLKKTPQPGGSSLPVLMVFCHLRWRFVFQRPQHLLSRLANRWRVIVVEEPVRSDGPAYLQSRLEQGADGASSVEVLVPHTAVDAGGFHDDQLAVLQGLLQAHLQAERLQVDIAWLYTPMALPLAKAVRPRALVYDCMDELAAFKNAPRQLRQRESALMKEAAFVLTGGPSLYESRRDANPQVVCLPSAVDAGHYAPSSLNSDCESYAAAQALQGALPRPRLGFFGVIDERLDVALVAAVADAHPEWAVVMAGPVVKIDPATLPQRANIHWIGMQPYERLPYLLAGWDVALMPFALNESTQFISPTKTLEYMAGEKPVVSTAVRDVVTLYGDAVAVADVSRGPQPFIAACEELLAESPEKRCRRALTMLGLVSQHAWSRSADSVHRLLLEALVPALEDDDALPAMAEAGVAELHQRMGSALERGAAQSGLRRGSIRLPSAGVGIG